MNRFFIKRFPLFFALVCFIFFGCKEKEGVKVANKENEESKISFIFSLPSDNSYTYRIGTIQHDAPEYAINILTMYTFRSDNKKLVAIDPIEKNSLLKQEEAKYSYTKTFTADYEGVYQFLFVANDPSQDVTIGETTQDEFEKRLLSKRLPDKGSSKDLLCIDNSTPENYSIPMTGIARQRGSSQIAILGGAQRVKVTLTRVVARLDISNQLPDFNITKIFIKNTSDRSSLFPSKNSIGLETFEVPMGTQKVVMEKGFEPLPTQFKGQKSLKKAFYLYEGQQPKAIEGLSNALTIIIEGDFDSGEHIVYPIPFTKSTTDNTPIAVKRNHLYHITLGDNKPLAWKNKISYTIEENPTNK